MSPLTTLPTHLMQIILSHSGSGGPAAAVTCRALSAAWRNALTLVPLAASFLLARYGPLTAARHVYSLTHHSQLLHKKGSKEQDGLVAGLLQQLCEAGAEVALHDALLLMQAARAGHASVVSELVRVARPSAFALSRALTTAAETGRRGIVRTLLAAGAQPVAYQSAALIAAAVNGDEEIVYLLCSAGADPTADNSRALRRAVQHGHVEAATMLLQYGADARALCSAALLHACELPATGSFERSINSKVIGGAEQRASSTASVERTAAGVGKADPFAGAAATGGVGGHQGQVCDGGEQRAVMLVRMLLRSGADARAHGRPALEAAAARGYAAVVGTLLAAGADPAACNSSALVAASIHGHTGVVGMLLESGADPWDVTDFALRTASERGHGPVLRAIRLAQVSASNAAATTAEVSLEGSSTCGSGGGSGISGGGDTTARVLMASACRWSVSPPPAAAAGRWSLHAMLTSGRAGGPAVLTSGGAVGLCTVDGTSLEEAFLSSR